MTFLITKRRLADTQYLTLWLEVTVQNPVTSFWTVTFSPYRTICLELFRSVASEKKQASEILKKKAILKIS